MKKIILVIGMLILVGCSAGKEKIETYIDEPQTLLKDPTYTTYKEQSDALEKQYLRKKITYAQYVEQKKELEEKYAKEASELNEKVSPTGKSHEAIR